MEHRFGIKDLAMFVMMGAVILVIVLAMKQFDRQWDELDKVIAEARKTVDEPKRMQLWHKAHRILHKDQPYTFLIARKILDFYDARFKNLQVTPLGMNEHPEWYVPAEVQRPVQ